MEPGQAASSARSWYTLAPCLEPVKLLSGPSVGELCKLFQLDSALPGNLFSLSPRTGMGTQARLLCRAWPSRHLLPSSQTELSSSPPHPASPSEAHGKLEGWDAGEERTFLNLAGAARQPRTRTLNKHFTDILILILSCWPLPFIHEDVKRWAYWPRILQYGIRFQSEVCCVPKQMEISQRALMRRLLCAGRQGIGSAKMNWTRPSSDWPAGEKDEKSPPIQGSVAGPPGPA